MEKRLIKCCWYDNLNGAKELLRDNPDINISYDDEDAFLAACYRGNLEIAKWLLSVKPDINISINNEYAFRYACIRGHLEIAKWLLIVKPDINISAEDKFAFHWTCANGHLEVAKWLQSLQPYLYVIEYDVNGKYIGYKIRSKEEANLERRKYALHLVCQEENNLLYYLPIDISKAVTMFV